MTIKELALVVERLRVEAEGCDPALIDKVISAGIPVSKASVEIARALLPLIAAELAGVAREHHEHGDEWYRHNKMATVGQTIAIAIEAHARKMGEAE